MLFIRTPGSKLLHDTSLRFAEFLGGIQSRLCIRSFPTKILHVSVVSNALLTPLGRMEAVLWRYLLYLRSESGPRQDRAVVVDTFHGVTEGHLLSVVSRVKEPTCVKIEHKVTVGRAFFCLIRHCDMQ